MNIEKNIYWKICHQKFKSVFDEVETESRVWDAIRYPQLVNILEDLNAKGIDTDEIWGRLKDVEMTIRMSQHLELFEKAVKLLHGVTIFFSGILALRKCRNFNQQFCVAGADYLADESL